MQYYDSLRHDGSGRAPSGRLIAAALTFLFLVPAIASAQGSWQVVSSTGLVGGTNVYFQDRSNGFAIGATTSATWTLRTTNGGEKWSGQTWGKALLFGLTSSGDSTVFVTGHWPQCTCAVIMRSPDKGKGWWMDTMNFSFGFYDIAFPAPTIGYTGGYNGAIMKTENNGITWERLNTPNYTDVFTNLYFPSADVGYAVAGPNGEFYKSVLLYRTLDGGSTWQQIADFTGVLNIFGMAWLDERTGVMISGSEGSSNILRSDDGGVTWNVVDADTGERYLYSLSFADSRTGYAVGEEGLILRTTDGGLTWSEEESPFNEDLLDVHAVADEAIVLTFGNTLLKRVTGSSVVYEPNPEAARTAAVVSLAPMPLSDASQLVVRNLPADASYSFILHDRLGREIYRVNDILPDVPVRIERGDIAAGLYLYRIFSSDNRNVAGGKVVVGR